MARKRVVKKQEGLDAPENLKILVTIVERDKANLYLDTLEGYEANFQLVMYGHGTASSTVYSILGLGELKKAIIFSVVKESKIKDILNLYEDKLFKTKKGKGICFTIPINSMIGVNLYRFLVNAKE